MSRVLNGHMGCRIVFNVLINTLPKLPRPTLILISLLHGISGSSHGDVFCIDCMRFYMMDVFALASDSALNLPGKSWLQFQHPSQPKASFR